MNQPRWLQRLGMGERITIAVGLAAVLVAIVFGVVAHVDATSQQANAGGASDVANGGNHNPRTKTLSGPKFTPTPTATPTPTPTNYARFLADQQEIDATFGGFNGLSGPPVAINSHLYSNSLVGELPDRIFADYVQGVYLLSRSCSELTATIGLSDQNSYTGGATFTVLGDGDKVLFSRPVGTGESVPITVDVTGVLRLTLRIAPIGEDAGNAQYGAFGDAEVVCTAPPVVPTPTGN